MTLLVVLLIIGFPVIAVLSWIYDITPTEEGETPPTEATQPFGVYAFTGLVLTVIGIGFWVSVGVVGVSFGGNTEVPSIGIIMMENLGSEDDEFWVSGMTADLITKLEGAGLIRVAPVTELSVEKIAEKLKVKYILQSSFHIKGDSFDLWYQLVNTEIGDTLISKTFNEPLDMTIQMVGKLAIELIIHLLRELTDSAGTITATGNYITNLGIF